MEKVALLAFALIGAITTFFYISTPKRSPPQTLSESGSVIHIDPEVDAILQSKFKFDIINYLPSNVQNGWLSKVAELERDQRTTNNSLTLEELTNIHTHWRANQWRAYFIGDPPWITTI